MKNWVKWLIIICIVIVSTIFFGSIVLSLAGFMFDFLSIVMNWLAVASRWLAKLFDIFGFTGIFSANTDIAMATQMISILKIGG